MLQNTDEQLKKRLNELAERADKLSFPVYTSFLTLAEQELFCRLSFPCTARLYGGFEEAERKIGCFGEDEFISACPVVCIKIAPANERFAEKLTHRDYLGSLMALGIRREMLGDIIIDAGSAYLFCLEQTADFIISELSSVKHTQVRPSRGSAPSGAQEDSEIKSVNIASERLDAVISAVFKLSRTDSAHIISQQRVFINGAVKDNTSRILKSGETVSVRGMGKFTYLGTEHTTKKGRLVAEVKLKGKG